MTTKQKMLKLANEMDLSAEGLINSKSRVKLCFA